MAAPPTELVAAARLSALALPQSPVVMFQCSPLLDRQYIDEWSSIRRAQQRRAMPAIIRFQCRIDTKAVDDDRKSDDAMLDVQTVGSSAHTDTSIAIFTLQAMFYPPAESLSSANVYHRCEVSGIELSATAVPKSCGWIRVPSDYGDGNGDGDSDDGSAHANGRGVRTIPNISSPPHALTLTVRPGASSAQLHRLTYREDCLTASDAVCGPLREIALMDAHAHYECFVTSDHSRNITLTVTHVHLFEGANLDLVQSCSHWTKSDFARASQFNQLVPVTSLGNGGSGANSRSNGNGKRKLSSTSKNTATQTVISGDINSRVDSTNSQHSTSANASSDSASEYSDNDKDFQHSSSSRLTSRINSRRSRTRLSSKEPRRSPSRSPAPRAPSSTAASSGPSQRVKPSFLTLTERVEAPCCSCSRRSLCQNRHCECFVAQRTCRSSACASEFCANVESQKFLCPTKTRHSAVTSASDNISASSAGSE